MMVHSWLGLSTKHRWEVAQYTSILLYLSTLNAPRALLSIFSSEDFSCYKLIHLAEFSNHIGLLLHEMEMRLQEIEKQCGKEQKKIPHLLLPLPFGTFHQLHFRTLMKVKTLNQWAQTLNSFLFF